MDIATYQNGEGQVVEVRGELTNAEDPERVVTAVERVLATAAPPLVKVNVRHVPIVDLEGIAALVKARKAVLGSGARFRLIDGQPRVRNRLAVTGLLHLLEDGA
ncbi:MAG TPA: STAS domain-containing protein [Actinomycetota bacterium]|nr:STAS domain-containing protein [Actinomycetota bacterium]